MNIGPEMDGFVLFFVYFFYLRPVVLPNWLTGAAYLAFLRPLDDIPLNQRQ